MVEKQPDRAVVWTFQEAEEVGRGKVDSFNSRAEICILRSQTHSFLTTPHFQLHLPNAEIALDLEANEVEVKGLTSLASVTEITAPILLDPSCFSDRPNSEAEAVARGVSCL